MVESLKELNQICQKPDYKTKGNWMVRHILRDAALPVTWLLLHTPVTANQVTLISLIIGLFGIALFACPSNLSFLIGTLFLQFWYLLDHVDGQIARYRKTDCMTGRFFDFITHHLIHGVIFFSLGFYVYAKTESFFFVAWGFVASIGMMMFNLINDTKYKTFFEKISSARQVMLLSQKDKPQLQKENLESPLSLKSVFSFLHKTIEIHVLMNILTLAAFLEWFVRMPLDLRFFLFLYYGFVVPLLAIAKITFIIKNRKIDDEFNRTFQLS